MITKNKIKYIRGLSLKKNRIRENCFVVEGEKMIFELINSPYRILELYATKDWISENYYVNAYKVTQLELDRMSNMKSANKVLALVEIQNQDNISKNGIKLVLDDITDPGNLGAIIRSCDWFGVTQIICSKNTVDVYNPKVVQATMGSLFRVNVLYVNLEDYLSKVVGHIYGASIVGKDIKRIKLNEEAHLIIGSESHGISSKLTKFIDTNITIKSINSKAESLNVSAATSILLYEFCN